VETTTQEERCENYNAGRATQELQRKKNYMRGGVV